MTRASYLLADPARVVLSNVTERLTRAIVESAAGGTLARVSERHQRIDPTWQAGNVASFFDAYDACCAQLSEAATSPVGPVVVWTVGSPNKWNPVTGALGYDRLCGMLALTFPDIQFAAVESVDDLLAAAALWSNGFCPLFDGAGVRDRVRQRARTSKSVDASYLPARVELALAVDDESSYAFLHAYAAYRFGFRSAPVTNRGLAKLLLGESDAAPLGPARLTFEDVFIQFPDASEENFDEHLSDLPTRQELWKGLANACERVFVTSGFRQPGDAAKIDSNTRFLHELASEGTFVRTLGKPYAGIFRLWDQSGLRYRWRRHESASNPWMTCGVAPGYAWPSSYVPTTGPAVAHSAEGTLLLVAQRVLQRAVELRDAAKNSMLESIRGAVLATDALELLGGRTPTLALDALRLKHEFEVLAECQFSGVEYHIPLLPRINEIQRDIDAVCLWFDFAQRTKVAANSEIAILSELTTIFSEFVQYDEEQECMARIRKLQGRLWRGEKWYRWLAAPVQWYVEQLLVSIPRFAMYLLAWVTFLTVMFTTNLGGDWGRGAESAVSTFFSIGAPVLHQVTASTAVIPESSAVTLVTHRTIASDTLTGTLVIHRTAADPPDPTVSKPFVFFVCLGIVAGCVHLGVFISHLYSALSRK